MTVRTKFYWGGAHRTSKLGRLPVGVGTGGFQGRGGGRGTDPVEGK